jgi:RNA-binding protein 25
MFVIEHLKDHKGPSKLVEELESVRDSVHTSPNRSLIVFKVLVDETASFVIAIWRQIVFESVAYGEALETGSLLVD